MKIKWLHTSRRIIYLCRILILLGFIFSASNVVKAQTPTVIGSYSVSASGLGTSGTPANFTWNIPAGKNRVMLITTVFERYQNGNANNYPTATEATGIPIKLNGNLANYTLVSGTTYTNPGTATRANSEFGTVTYMHRIIEANGIPTGPTVFDFSGIIPPKYNGDEVIISIVVMDNVSAQIYGAQTVGADFRFSFTSNTNILTLSPAAYTPVPIGRTANEILYLSVASMSQDRNIVTSGSWVNVQDLIRTNSSGNPVALPTANEPDGIALKISSLYTSGVPTLTHSRFTGTAVNTHMFYNRMFAVLPLAKPLISGTVFNDVDGPANINGTVTNAGGLYVNAIDNTTGLLIYSAAVNGSGVFNIPTGYVLEGDTYRLELSANTGTIGAAAPAKALPANWNTVGESSTGISPYVSDGLNDGTIVYTMANTNVTNLRYGINRCTNPPATGTPDGYTQTGISNLVGFANGWPGNVANGFIAIESKNKGFVITRVANTAAIATPVEGMLIYDNSANCVKLYYSSAWHCLAKDCGG